jgi:hypothetical protein
MTGFIASPFLHRVTACSKVRRTVGRAHRSQQPIFRYR